MKILYEDEYMLVCEKAAGVPVQTASVRVKDLTDEVRAYRQNPYVGIVHRLDQPVRGIVVFALDEASAADLSEQVCAQAGGRQMEKTYLALVQAPDAEKSGSEEKQDQCLEDYLIRDPKTNTSRVVDRGTKGAKRAVLEYRTAGVWELCGPCGSEKHGQSSEECPPDAEKWQAAEGTVMDEEAFRAARTVFAEEMDRAAAALSNGITQLRYKVLRIHLVTGRHHQIRVQLAAAGMPVAGDRKYGVLAKEPGNRKALAAGMPAASERKYGEAAEDYAGEIPGPEGTSGGRMVSAGSAPELWTGAPALCAWRLEMNHPRSGQRMLFEYMGNPA